MEKSKQLSQQAADNAKTDVKFWGTIAVALLAILVDALLLWNTLQLPRTAIVYVAMAVYTLVILASFPVIILTLRGRQNWAAEIGFYMTMMIFGSTMFIYTGRVFTASFSLATISAIMISQLLPRETRRRHILITAGVLLVMWAIEWINPGWRITTTVGRFGPAAAIMLGLILAFIFISQIWDRISLLWKMSLLTGLLILGMISIAVGAYVGVQNLQYQLSNIYDFMLVPIVAIDHADVALADAELQILQVQYGTTVDAEITTGLTKTLLSNQLAKEVVDRYNKEWVTTISPEFTQALSDAGLLYLQQQEITALDSLNSSMAAYQSAFDRYLLGVKSGELDETLSVETVVQLRATRRNLEDLIDINSQYAEFSNNAAQAAARQALGTNFVVLAIGIIVSLAASYLIVVSITRRVTALTHGATAIQSGNLDQTVTVTGHDEISLLGTVFNEMTSRLKDLFGTLEQRVADRTRNLELAAEVGRSVSQVRALHVMLEEACELILKEFKLYYVQVYLTDTSGTTLQLEAGTGSVGAQLTARGHSLPLNSGSINGRAATEKRSVVISDTSQSATFRQNPLLPLTRGEMAVPLIVADKVVGVLDMQSSAPGLLTTEVLPAFEALAGQLGVAIQNANLLTQAEQARAEVEKQARRLVRTGWTEHLDAIHKPELISFVYDRKEVKPLAETQELDADQSLNMISSSISVTGEKLGSLVVEMPHESGSEQAAELVNLVARQVAQQIENLRLLESAERYRFEAEEASRRLTREGWKSYVEDADDALGYVYDLKEVRPHQVGGDDVIETTGYTLPLKVRDEMIGKLVVQGLQAKDEDAVSLVSEVAERLGAHLESLRQFEETQRGQMELDKRARQLAAVAEVSSVSSRELDVQKMLESVVYLTQRKFGLYHAHIFIYNEQTDLLKIAACGWKEGDEHEGTHGTAQIPLTQEQSLVARAARTRQSVIVNDVHNEPGWLPNPLLPDSVAELAVPLIIGDKLLGVLDVQSDHMHAFSDEDASIYLTLAAQIATALQNAQSFAQAQQQAERESRLNVISQKIQSATTVEAVLQIAARELGHTLGAPLTIAQLGLKETASDN